MGCENARDLAQQAATQPVKVTVAQPARPRSEIPKEIMACLHKRACLDDRGNVRPECDKARNIVSAYINAEGEKAVCVATLSKWDKEQARIAASESAAATGHPRSGGKANPPKVKADWP